MTIRDIMDCLEEAAPLRLQENYDNCGLLLGNEADEITSALICLDATSETIEEAAQQGCKLLISHHPAIFSGVKSLAGNSFTQQTLRAAIQNNIALYAIHTNLDNVLSPGVNGKIGEMLGIKPKGVLQPMRDVLRKLVTYCPIEHSEAILSALFQAGAGFIGQYSECSFSMEGSGTFKASDDANPFVGKIGERHYEPEKRLEVVFPSWIEKKLINALLAAHPYEEVAFDIYKIENTMPHIGAGAYGELAETMDIHDFLNKIKSAFKCGAIRHTRFKPGKTVKTVAWCGGSGSFLLSAAKAVGADVFITGDFKYHQFFDADEDLLIADIGHYESEQFTPLLIQEIIRTKFPTFAALLSKSSSNPVFYL